MRELGCRGRSLAAMADGTSSSMHIDSKEKQDSDKVTCSQMSEKPIVKETLNCSCCTHSQRLREEIETLLNRLSRNEHEYERLLSRVMEEKLEEAEKMNQIYERMKRHQRRRELLQ